MKHSRLTFTFVAVICFVSFHCKSACSWPTVFPTGVTVHERPKAQEGFVLFAPMGSAPGGQGSTLYLIDTNGDVRHTWNFPITILTAKLLPNGNVQVIGQNDTAQVGRPGIDPYKIGGYAGWLLELTWDGERVFKHIDLRMHHEFTQLHNGHFAYLAWEKVPNSLQKKVRGGLKGTEFKDGTMMDDMIVEIDHQGKTVWEWHGNQHFDPTIDIINPLQKREEWCHANNLVELSNGNLLVTSRALDSAIEIEKKTGKIINRYGNTAYVDAATGWLELRTGTGTLGGPHDASEIPAGHQGAGHLLCYDNGLYTGISRAVEIDRITHKVVWESQDVGIGRKHFSDFLGSVERLPNGNTLVCDGANGRFFQTNPRGEIVWEYINPFVPTPLCQGAVFKIHFYTADYCEKFKDLPNP